MSNNAQKTATTIDEKEKETLKQYSTVWWDENGAVKILHSIIKLVVPFIRDQLAIRGLVEKELLDTPAPLKELLVLEVGCGGGILSESLAKMGCELIALDISEDLLDVAKKHGGDDPAFSRLSYILEAIEEHCENNSEKYDVVVSNFVLEHVNEHELFLNSCAKCVKPGGSIFLSTMSKTFMGWFSGIIIAENVLRYIPRGAHQYEKFITPAAVNNILKKNNIKPVDVRGISYSTMSNTWKWIKSTSVFYMIHAVKE